MKRDLALGLLLPLALGCSETSSTGPPPGSDSGSRDSGGAGSGAGSKDGSAAASEGGTVPETVLSCESLREVGHFENITPPGVRFTQDFVLHPTEAGTLYLGTALFEGVTGGLHKSTDCGATWILVSTGENADAINHSGKWTLVIDPVSPDTIYTSNGYGSAGVFKSTNGGVDFRQVVPKDVLSAFDQGGHVQRITMDPADHLHLLVTPHFSCVGEHAGSCMLETKDGGSTWKVLDHAPPGGEDTAQMMFDSRHWLYAASDWHMYQTLDAGASWQQVFEGWTTDQEPYRSSDGTYYLASESAGVIRSKDGLTWEAIPDSPRSIRAVIGDGTTLFTSNRRDCDACQPYMQAPERDPAHFTTYPSPPLPRGGWRLRYDTAHRVLYSSTETNGLWRVVTRAP